MKCMIYLIKLIKDLPIIYLQTEKNIYLDASRKDWQTIFIISELSIFQERLSLTKKIKGYKNTSKINIFFSFGKIWGSPMSITAAFLAFYALTASLFTGEHRGNRNSTLGSHIINVRWQLRATSSFSRIWSHTYCRPCLGAESRRLWFNEKILINLCCLMPFQADIKESSLYLWSFAY